MPRPGGNPTCVGKKGRSGRKGYNFESLVNRSIELVSTGLETEDKTLKGKEKFDASLEIVKKALPTNVNLGGNLKVTFNEVFKSTRQANRDSKEPSKI